ncbi:MAG: Chromate resistance protein ChrB, partial [Acidimicrobiales bacterium]
HFTYAELEENDEDLNKLKGWYAKVHARDVLASTGAAAAEKALAECDQALNGFAERVYQEESRRMGDHA